MINTNKCDESGRSMIEMLGVLAVVGVLSVGGIAGYGVAMDKYRASELLYGASKRAMSVANQLALGESADLSDFNGETVAGGTFVNETDIRPDANDQFTLTITNVKSSVCNQMKNTADRIIRKFESDCDDNGSVKLTYNKDLSIEDKTNKTPLDTLGQYIFDNLGVDGDVCGYDNNCPGNIENIIDYDPYYMSCKDSCCTDEEINSYLGAMAKKYPNLTCHVHDAARCGSVSGILLNGNFSSMNAVDCDENKVEEEMVTVDGFVNNETGAVCNPETKPAVATGKKSCSVCRSTYSDVDSSTGEWYDSDALCPSGTCMNGACVTQDDFGKDLCRCYVVEGEDEYGYASSSGTCGTSTHNCTSDEDCIGWGVWNNFTQKCEPDGNSNKCQTNSDCASIKSCSEGKCFCKFDTDYDIFDTEKGPHGKVGNCVAKASYKGTFNNPAIEAEGYIRSSNYMYWFNARNFCLSYGKNLVSLSSLGVPVANCNPNCGVSEQLADEIARKLEAQDWIWAREPYHHWEYKESDSYAHTSSDIFVYEEGGGKWLCLVSVILYYIRPC